MQIECKYISRKGWRRILESDSAYTLLDYDNFKAVAGLLYLKKVREPLKTTVLGQSLIIVDDGYLWIQVGPEGENWWLSVMFDKSRRIIQYYFDVTMENILCGEGSYFYDLFLDVVALPDGQVVLLDVDELDAALNEGKITKDEYGLAIRTAHTLMREVPVNIKRLERFCYEIFDMLNRLLSKKEGMLE